MGSNSSHTDILYPGAWARASDANSPKSAKSEWRWVWDYGDLHQKPPRDDQDADHWLDEGFPLEDECEGTTLMILALSSDLSSLLISFAKKVVELEVKGV